MANLEEDRLFSFFDTQVAIEDPMLLQSLASSRTDKMKAITATIQAEQNAVIRCADVPVLLVNGIAGSVKTSSCCRGSPTFSTAKGRI